jgi:tetratricopeptide (TPR) repeat protein
MTLRLALVALALVCATAPAAVADGGGGGGGGMSSPAPNVGSREDPTAAYQAGVAALNAQNYQEAVRQFRSARRAAPNDGLINYALGLALVGAGETDDARGALERSARASNAPAGARLQLGLLYLQGGDRDHAVEQQAALQEAINDCDARCGDQRRAQLQAAYDQLTTALNAPPAAPAADPATTGWNFPSVEEGRVAYAEAVGLINQERFAQGLDALSRAQAAVGPHPDVLNYMGFASRKLGRLDDALTYYGEALAIDPNHLGANEYLGELYIQMGDLGRARRQLARLDNLCAYGCTQREELARWIATASE